MKKTHLLYIVCLLLSSSLLLNGLAQDFAAQWHLPEGAKARLGRGKLINIKLSSDSTRVVVSTSIGIWIYDAQTNEVVSLFTEKQTGEKDGFLSKRPPEALTFSPTRQLSQLLTETAFTSGIPSQAMHSRCSTNTPIQLTPSRFHRMVQNSPPQAEIGQCACGRSAPVNISTV